MYLLSLLFFFCSQPYSMLQKFFVICWKYILWIYNIKKTSFKVKAKWENILYFNPFEMASLTQILFGLHDFFSTVTFTSYIQKIDLVRKVKNYISLLMVPKNKFHKHLSTMHICINCPERVKVRWWKSHQYIYIYPLSALALIFHMWKLETLFRCWNKIFWFTG